MFNKKLTGMKKKILVMSLFVWTFFNNNLCSQSRLELRNIFFDAESWILFEDYKEALPLYLALNRAFPDNANIKYRLGQCYINTPGEKEKAISFLESAVKDINPDYKKGRFNETCAPPDAFFHLAHAYLINNRLDKALETYNIFNNNLNPVVYDTAVVRLQIQACLNAGGLIKKPLYIKEKNLGNSINREYSEFNPVISDDEKILVFTRSYPFYDALLYCTKNDDGKWSVPINMNEILKVDNYYYPTSISHDGKELYLYSSVDYDGIIYSTRFENGTWTPLEKLNDNINTKFWESHATISHDNRKLYFTSNRKGTIGGLDIYVSERDSNGEWGIAQNLGPVINTPYNEESPFLSIDDKTLYFSSRGHFGMGGYDYFYTTQLENAWSVPLNVGFPLNTTDDDVFYKPINDGYEGYVSKFDPKGYGRQDIYKIEIFTDEHPRKFFVKGTAKVAFTSIKKNDRIQISARNTENQKKPVIVNTDPRTGEYSFGLPDGSYEFSYKAPGAEPLKKSIMLPLSYPSDTVLLPGMILQQGDFTADLSILGSKERVVTKEDPVQFNLQVEPGSVLTIRRWNGEKLISSRQYSVEDSLFSYSIIPSRGNNRIAFNLKDSYNNSASDNAYVTWKDKNSGGQNYISLQDIRMLPPSISITSLNGVQDQNGANNLVSLKIAMPVKKSDISFAGINHDWILAAIVAWLILVLIIYLKRKKKDFKTA